MPSGAASAKDIVFSSLGLAFTLQGIDIAIDSASSAAHISSRTDRVVQFVFRIRLCPLKYVRLVPHPFKSYEVEVLKLLLAQEFSEDAIMQFLEGASSPKVEYTNYGFYISITHPAIGKPRRVCSDSNAHSARSGRHSAGFVAFLEDDKLTLEIFPWDGEALPVEFRESEMEVAHKGT